MSRRKLVGGSSALAVALVIGLLVLDSPWSDHGDTRAPSSSEAGSNKGTGSGSKKTDRITDGKGSEVTKLPEGSATNGLPGLSKKPPAKDTWLISQPLPETASTRGKVVKGFPLAIVPVPSGSAVESSGVSSKAKALQVSILATNKRSPEEILTYYRTALTAHGFGESTVPAVGGSTAASFEHGLDNLVVTVTRTRSKGSTYSVFGTLHAGKS